MLNKQSFHTYFEADVLQSERDGKVRLIDQAERENPADNTN